MKTIFRSVMLLTLVVVAMNALADGTFPEVAKLPEVKELPDALRMLDGTEVKTAQEWRQKRRPEIVGLVQHYMYGFAPDAPKVSARKEAADTPVYDGKGILRQVELTLEGLPGAAPKIHLAIFLPTEHAGRVPVFLGINKCGNLGVSNEKAVIYNPNAYVHKECPAGGEGCRGVEAAGWSVETFLARGYAFATFHESDLDADDPDSDVGVQKYFKLEQPADAQWATIRCWAWGFSRCVDYLINDKDIDPKRIAVTGHSRRGKTALLAAAMDPRISLCNPHQSGTGGTALSRDNDQETVKIINTNFPHWFDGNFKQFNDNAARIPFDQHLLVALIAPRALIDTQGLQDKWANGAAGLRGEQAVDKVWKLLGAKGQVGTGVLDGPAPINADTAGNLLQYRLDTKHEQNRDYWEKVLDFADMVWGPATK